MAAKDSIQIWTAGEGRASLTDPHKTSRGKLKRFANRVGSLIRGTARTSTVMRDTLCAGHTFALSSASGDITATINGVAVTVTYATSDTNTAGLLKTAINAETNALVAGLVEADNRAATITLTSTATGTWFEVCGVRFVAVAKAAGRVHEFEVSGNDTADAAALVVCINAHPVTQDLVMATNSSGVVTVRSRRASTSDLDLTIRGSGEVVSAAKLTAGATVYVSAVRKGKSGNCITLAATGTGATAGGARLIGGTTATTETF